MSMSHALFKNKVMNDVGIIIRSITDLHLPSSSPKLPVPTPSVLPVPFRVNENLIPKTLVETPKCPPNSFFSFDFHSWEGTSI